MRLFDLMKWGVQCLLYQGIRPLSYAGSCMYGGSQGCSWSESTQWHSHVMYLCCAGCTRTGISTCINQLSLSWVTMSSIFWEMFEYFLFLGYIQFYDIWVTPRTRLVPLIHNLSLFLCCYDANLGGYLPVSSNNCVLCCNGDDGSHSIEYTIRVSKLHYCAAPLRACSMQSATSEHCILNSWHGWWEVIKDTSKYIYQNTYPKCSPISQTARGKGR